MSDLDLIYGTKPQTVSSSEERPTEEQKASGTSKESSKKAIKRESYRSSTQASKKHD